MATQTTTSTSDSASPRTASACTPPSWAEKGAERPRGRTCVEAITALPQPDRGLDSAPPIVAMSPRLDPNTWSHGSPSRARELAPSALPQSRRSKSATTTSVWRRLRTPSAACVFSQPVNRNPPSRNHLSPRSVGLRAAMEADFSAGQVLRLVLGVVDAAVVVGAEQAAVLDAGGSAVGPGGVVVGVAQAGWCFAALRRCSRRRAHPWRRAWSRCGVGVCGRRRGPGSVRRGRPG